jgi:hypothetical protein
LMLLPMHIGLICSSPIDILLGIINGSCSYGFSIWSSHGLFLGTCHKSFKNSNQTSISLWQTLYILTHYFSMPNIPLSHCSLHLSLSYVYDPILDTNPSFKEL